MQIWVDADACPKAVKEILFRAAVRTKTLVTFVANQPFYTPPSPYIKKTQVSAGFDEADNYIAGKIQAGDLVITADIPLADAIIAKGASALNPRGNLYTKENIKQQLSIRNINAEFRDAGMLVGGLSALSQKEIQAFANRLNNLLMNRG